MQRIGCHSVDEGRTVNWWTSLTMKVETYQRTIGQFPPGKTPLFFINVFSVFIYSVTITQRYWEVEPDWWR